MNQKEVRRKHRKRRQKKGMKVEIKEMEKWKQEGGEKMQEETKGRKGQ